MTTTTKSPEKKRKTKKVYTIEEYLTGVPEDWQEKIRKEFKPKEKIEISIGNGTKKSFTKEQYEARQTLYPLNDGVPDTSSGIVVIDGSLFTPAEIERAKVIASIEFKFGNRTVVVKSDGTFTTGCQENRKFSDHVVKTIIGGHIESVPAPSGSKYFHNCNCKFCDRVGFYKESTRYGWNSSGYVHMEGYELFVKYAIIKPLILERLEEMTRNASVPDKVSKDD